MDSVFALNVVDFGFQALVKLKTMKLVFAASLLGNIKE